MSTEKIVEMANDIAMICPDLVENGCGDMNCITCLAQGLVREGYGRYGEWISVDERLPEESGEYITWHDGYYGLIAYNTELRGWNIFHHSDRSTEIRTVTHWMPRPEPPKMKGGE